MPRSMIALNGPRLRRLRENLGLSQVEAAMEIGISRSMLSALETGSRRASPKIARMVANRHGLEIKQIRRG